MRGDEGSIGLICNRLGRFFNAKEAVRNGLVGSGCRLGKGLTKQWLVVGFGCGSVAISSTSSGSLSNDEDEDDESLPNNTVADRFPDDESSAFFFCYFSVEMF